jgi:restriction system protein
MEILGFLLGLGCLILVAWTITILGGLVFGRKRRQQNRPQKPPSLTPPKIQERNSAQSTIAAPPALSAPPRRVVTLRQPTSTRVRQTSNRHQQYIRLADSVLKRLRDRIVVVQLPEALAILRKMNPYAFEELLLTCCQNQGWKIERNFRYTGDGGLDGRVTIAGRLYLIQAKRYCGYINLKHILDFNQVIQQEKAYGGFFIHTGKTGKSAKELLREYRISLLSGQRLVNFVLGQKLKVLG